MKQLGANVMNGEKLKPSNRINRASLVPVYYDLFSLLGFPPVPIWSCQRDGDGNCTGGIRTPSVTTLFRSQTYGAPLGKYTGTEFEVNYDPANNLVFRAILTLFGGTYEP